MYNKRKKLVKINFPEQGGEGVYFLTASKIGCARNLKA